MTLRGGALRWLYSGAVSSGVAQSNPLISLGGFRADNGTPANSEPYRETTLDAVSPSIIQLNDTQTDTPATADPAIDDWVVVTSGPAAGSFGRVVAVNYVSHVITIDRPLSALAQSGNLCKFSRRQNVFPDATLAQIQSGVVDHRQLFILKTDAGNESNFTFWVQPLQSNGCDIELVASGDPIVDHGTVPTSGSSIATATESPFNAFGRVLGSSQDWDHANYPRRPYSQAAAVPDGGSIAVTDEGSLAVWLRRTIPADASPGECVFILWAYVSNAVAQDATADPNPFQVGFVFAWNNPEPAYAIRIFSDRQLQTGGSADIIGEVSYPDGTPAVGLNARIEKIAGDGSLEVNFDEFTDDLGRVRARYTCPASVGTDPTFRVSVPASSRV